MDLKCTGGCIEIHKVLYSCNERNESASKQESIVNKICKGKEECQVTADRKTFGEDECPGTPDREMNLWITYSCNGNADDKSKVVALLPRSPVICRLLEEMLTLACWNVRQRPSPSWQSSHSGGHAKTDNN